MEKQIEKALEYFYPRPPRGGRPHAPGSWAPTARISIHALREEGDKSFPTLPRSPTNFYPRPPRGGRRDANEFIAAVSIFLSTPSARRATQPWLLRCRQRLFLSTPSARRATYTGIDLSGLEDVFLSTPSARRATAKTETKSLFSNKLYNILHEFRRALIYNGSKNYPNHAKRLENPVRRCRENAENSPFAPGRKTQNNSRPSCSKGG